jgi:hypothetical protein
MKKLWPMHEALQLLLLFALVIDNVRRDLRALHRARTLLATQRPRCP